MITPQNPQESFNRKVLFILLASIAIIMIISAIAYSKIEQAEKDKEQYRQQAENAQKDREEIQNIALALGLATTATNLASHAKTLFTERNELSAANVKLNESHKILAANKAAFEVKTRNAVSRSTQTIASGLTRTATRQVATAPGKSIPILGTTFVAGFALLDVYEACEMIKALNELNVEIGTPPNKADADKICGLNVPTSAQLSAQISTNWNNAYSAAAQAANQAGNKFPPLPPPPNTANILKQACSIFNYKVPPICP